MPITGEGSPLQPWMFTQTVTRVGDVPEGKHPQQRAQGLGW